MTNKPGDIACARPNNVARVDCRVRRANKNVFPVPLTALSAETSKRKISLREIRAGRRSIVCKLWPRSTRQIFIPVLPLEYAKKS